MQVGTYSAASASSCTACPNEDFTSNGPRTACICIEGHFGADCSQVATPSAASVPPTVVEAGAPAVVKSASGVGIDLPAGALAAGATLEVKVYDIEVTISDDQPGDPIKPAGILFPYFFTNV
jgi:hypothetical protein